MSILAEDRLFVDGVEVFPIPETFTQEYKDFAHAYTQVYGRSRKWTSDEIAAYIRRCERAKYTTQRKYKKLRALHWFYAKQRVLGQHVPSEAAVNSFLA